MLGLKNITMSRRAEQFFSGNFLNTDAVGEILTDVANDCIRPGGLFFDHLARGQSEWPALDPDTIRKKGDDMKFVQSGGVVAALTQKVQGGTVAKFGSSADIYSSGVKSIQLSAKGLFIRAVPVADGQQWRLTIGFVGSVRQSTGFKKLRKELAGTTIAKSDKLMRAEARRRGIKKFTLGGSRGFTGGGGKSKMLLARGKENLGYANIVQSGSFKGFRKKSGQLVAPRALAYQKKAFGRKYGKDEGKVEFGKARPLLPARSSDAPRIMIVLHGSILKLTQRFQAAS